MCITSTDAKPCDKKVPDPWYHQRTSMWATTQVLQTSPSVMSLQHSVGVKGQDALAEQKAVQMKAQPPHQNLLSRM